MNRLPHHVPTFVLSCLLLTIWIVVASLGCAPPASSSGTNPAKRQTPNETTNEQTKPTAERESTAYVRLTDSRFRVEKEDDPAQEGWQSEAFSRAAQRQLKQLQKAIEHRELDSSSAMRQILDENFACGPLRPVLREVYRDRAVRVLRPTRELNSKLSHSGAGGLQEAIHALHVPFQDCVNLRAKLKIVGVEVAPRESHTTVRVEIAGLHGHGSVQQVARWRCTWRNEEESPLLKSLMLEDYEEVSAEATQGTLLSDCTISVLGKNEKFYKQLLPGSDDWLHRIEIGVGLETIGHQGLAIGDVNGDGLEDVYICQSAGLPNRLFLQNQDGTASEAAAEFGLDWLEPSYGALFVDLDNDADQDLLLATDANVLVLENRGDLGFRRSLALPHGRPVYSLAAADFDADGDIDVYACVYHAADADTTQLTQHPVPMHDANNGGRNVLWRNDGRTTGDWRFRDVTAETGLDHNNRRWSFAASWEDYDNDGDFDLYVANDFGRNNLYRNIGSRTSPEFADEAAGAAIEDGAFGMSVTWGDYDRDGWMDVYVSNMFSSAGNRITYQRRFQPAADDAKVAALRRMSQGNSLFRNAKSASFHDVSAETGTSMGRWSWSSKFIDLNNDGWLDLLVTNGYLTNPLSDDL